MLLGNICREGNGTPLPWKIPWMEEPGRLQSMGLRRVGHDWTTSLSLFPFMHWRRKWQPVPVFLPGESQGWEPGGLLSMGSHRVGHDWHDLEAAAAGNIWHIEILYMYNLWSLITKQTSLSELTTQIKIYSISSISCFDLYLPTLSSAYYQGATICNFIFIIPFSYILSLSYIICNSRIRTFDFIFEVSEILWYMSLSLTCFSRLFLNFTQIGNCYYCCSFIFHCLQYSFSYKWAI